MNKKRIAVAVLIAITFMVSGCTTKVHITVDRGASGTVTTVDVERNFLMR